MVIEAIRSSSATLTFGIGLTIVGQGQHLEAVVIRGIRAPEDSLDLLVVLFNDALS